ncbi:MAG TPA: magnesium transporter [Herpetosiphonaceae bacterium]|nr:magnesium transporter [Herpetosiphonaceae bacterium]
MSSTWPGTTEAPLEQQVRTALDADDLEGLRGLLALQHPADIADVIDRLDDQERLRVFRLLDLAHAAEVLDETDLAATRALIARLPAGEAADLLDVLPPDDAAEILAEDVPDRQEVLLAAMEPADAAEVRALLHYPPQSAGRLMTEKFARIAPEMTAAEAIAHLRGIDHEVETIRDLYALDAQERLLGSLSLRAVIMAPEQRLLAELLQPPVVTVTPETDQEQVARLVSQYDLLSLPVVTADGRMLGIVTVDDVIDVLVAESTEDVLRLGAVESGRPDETYFDTPLLRTVRRRVGWLLILFLTGTITINVLGQFEAALDQMVALSFFIPLLIGTGGNTGAQTVSTMVRGMALGEIELRDGWRVIGRELASGLVLGLLLAVVAFAFALLLGNPPDLALVVALAVIAVCTWANTIGALVPLVAQRLGLDPALVSAPLITTLVDATGLAIYLLIATAVLGL